MKWTLIPTITQISDAIKIPHITSPIIKPSELVSEIPKRRKLINFSNGRMQFRSGEGFIYI